MLIINLEIISRLSLGHNKVKNMIQMTMIHKNTYLYRHVHIYTQTNVYMYRYIYTCTHAHSYTYTCIYMHMHTHMHTLIHIYEDTHTDTRIHLIRLVARLYSVICTMLLSQFGFYCYDKHHNQKQRRKERVNLPYRVHFERQPRQEPGSRNGSRNY